ncbi:unnamed protein product [Hydatigera taeniaeformis]|uniref:Uncharacterized protein n=1 Tax=Hydatigena taeniaeformis TaxID=6205 RepID=A0A0R3WZH3_HYDTA|nr:unnamed protein product [Hydatigera taeniaeformis]
MECLREDVGDGVERGMRHLSSTDWVGIEVIGMRDNTRLVYFRLRLLHLLRFTLQPLEVVALVPCLGAMALIGQRILHIGTVSLVV